MNHQEIVITDHFKTINLVLVNSTITVEKTHNGFGIFVDYDKSVDAEQIKLFEDCLDSLNYEPCRNKSVGEYPWHRISNAKK